MTREEPTVDRDGGSQEEAETMSASDEGTVWGEWKKWEKCLDEEVGGLNLSRNIYRSLNEIVKGNAHLGKDEHVWWMFMNYGLAALMAIRRLTEKKSSRNDNLSLQTILNCMQRHCDLITRKHFIDDYDQKAERTSAVFDGEQPTEELRATIEKQGEGELHARLDKGFNDLAAEGQDSFPKNILVKHSEKVEAIHRRIGPLVDKYLAHYDLDRQKPEITFDELDELIDGTIEEFRFVHQVIAGVPNTSLPQENHDWARLLRIP